MIRTFNGPYSALAQAFPSRGDSLSESKYVKLKALPPAFGSFFIVFSAELTPDEGDSATLTVRLVAPGEGPGVNTVTIGKGGAASSARIEFGNAQADRDIKFHPMFKALTAADHEVVELHLAGDKDVFLPGGENGELRSSLAHKIRRGQTAYTVFAPTVTVRTGHRKRPDFSASKLGKIDEPPEKPNGTEDLVWRKIRDEATHPGEMDTWDRIQEWMAAESWDKDLYGDGYGYAEGEEFDEV